MSGCCLCTTIKYIDFISVSLNLPTPQIMCLYISIKAKPQILSEPLRVYKLLFKNNMSLFRHFVYEKNQKVSAEISMAKPEDINTDFVNRLCPEDHMPVPPLIDDIEYAEMYLYIIKHSLYYKTDVLPTPTFMQMPAFIRKDTLLQIDSGLHFFYTVERAVQYMLNSHIAEGVLKIGEFEIPAGSTVYTGIDDSLGVTDTIILRKAFLVKDFKSCVQ